MLSSLFFLFLFVFKYFKYIGRLVDPMVINDMMNMCRYGTSFLNPTASIKDSTWAIRAACFSTGTFLKTNKIKIC